MEVKTSPLPYGMEAMGCKRTTIAGPMQFYAMPFMLLRPGVAGHPGVRDFDSRFAIDGG
jgi:hypothetical protein